jgi:aryl-alcohol dehydrogenase-like predicted oxidoreductase
MGTERSSRDWLASHWRSLDGLRASSVGLGTYLGLANAPEDASYATAIAAFLARGGNLVDTAINYRCQRSERTLGKTLGQLIEAGNLRRSDVIVCTKGGYIPSDGQPPASLETFQQDIEAKVIDAGLASSDEVAASCHCISPKYIEDALERSRQNLALATVDVYYVHNPEMQLIARPLEAVLATLRQTFAALEASVKRGDIARYGIATWNGLRVAPHEPGHLPLEAVVEAAKDAGGEDHHLRVVQVPFSLAMPEAFSVRCQRVGDELMTPLAAAAELGLYAVGSAPLLQGSLAARVPAGFRARLTGLASDAQAALHYARSAPGMAATLVGMRSEAHVSENMALASVPAIDLNNFRRFFT